MAESGKPDVDVRVPCAVCMKEIPVSEAKSEEASDYVRYFCGLDCYAKWKQQERDKSNRK